MEIIGIAFAALLGSNIVLSRFLGICPFLGVSKKSSNAIGMGLALIVVVTLSSMICYGLDKLLVLLGMASYLELVVFILVIASFVQLLEFFLKKYIPSLYKSLGVYLPLITTNCVVLQVCLDLVSREYNFLQTITYSVSTAAGYMLVIVLFSFIRMRLDNQEMPKAFKGNAIALITAGLMAMAFMAFSGFKF
ncbi:MAG: Rnf-Nqr domain containing protein [Bacillales bacterium]|nr:Rnf-Nqr domain containing protein [Bacillales bacterium]